MKCIAWSINAYVLLRPPNIKHVARKDSKASWRLFEHNIAFFYIRAALRFKQLGPCRCNFLVEACQCVASNMTEKLKIASKCHILWTFMEKGTVLSYRKNCLVHEAKNVYVYVHIQLKLCSVKYDQNARFLNTFWNLERVSINKIFVRFNILLLCMSIRYWKWSRKTTVTGQRRYSYGIEKK